MDTREVGGVRVPEVEVIDLEEPDEQEVIRPGSFLATSGYDGRINLWSTGDWSLVASLGGHADDKIMSVDISPASSSVANSPTVALCSTGWDRTLRLWSS